MMNRETKRLEFARFLEHLHHVFTASLDTIQTADTTIPIPKTYECCQSSKMGALLEKSDSC